MVGVALAFCSGSALAAGGPLWSAALLLFLLLLRPRLPFHRPRPAILAVVTVAWAGALHAGIRPWGDGPAPASPRFGVAGEGVGTGVGPSRSRGPSSAAAASGLPTAEVPGLRERLRSRALTRVRAVFPSEAPMVEALVLAERGGLDPEVRAAFVRTGAAHLLAISGFHVGVLAGWVVLLLRLARLSRTRASWGAAVVVWGYVALLGFPTSAVRAGLLLSGAAVGRLRGRPVHSLGAWGLALLIVALSDPSVVESPGAQLSFAGALGLILWADPWSRFLRRLLDRIYGTRERVRVRDAAAGALAASAAAQVATLPLAVWHFQRVAVLALPATLLATPMVSLALPGAFLAMMAHALHIPGATVLASGVEAMLWATRRLMEGMSGWDPGWLLGRTSVLLATGAALTVWTAARRRVERSLRVLWCGAGVLAAIAVAPWAETTMRPATLEIRALDVGQGDAIAVGTPSGRWILVDTGSGSGERLARELVAGGIRRLHLLILTHPDLDHMGAAAELLSQIPVEAVADGGTLRGTEAFRELVDAARTADLPWRVLRRGATWTLDGVRFEVLHPDAGNAVTEPNDRSVVVRVTWGAFDALFTGDISVAVEEALLPFLEPVEVLKVAHHGSRTSTTRLRNTGGQVLRTDRHGAIAIRGRADGSFTVRTVKSWDD